MISAALLFSSNTAAYSLGASRPVVSARGSAVMAETEKADGWKAAGLAAALALATGVQSASAGPFTRTEIASLTYEQIKGTGLANTCPKVEAGGDQKISVGGKKVRIEEFCLEPTSFQVLEEKLTKQGLVTEAVDTKVTTRQTYVLTGIEGDLVSEGGGLVFKEQDGIDYAPTTVQLPGGERVPFLFTVKNLVAKANTADISTGTKFAGGFKVRTHSLSAGPRSRSRAFYYFLPPFIRARLRGRRPSTPPLLASPSHPPATRCARRSPRTAPVSSSTRRAVAPRPATTRRSRSRRCRPVVMRACSRRTTRSSRCVHIAATAAAAAAAFGTHGIRPIHDPRRLLIVCFACIPLAGP